jgi:molecular chaperone GrpE
VSGRWNPIFLAGGEEDESPSFRVVDRRRHQSDEHTTGEDEESREELPAFVEELRTRAEKAEEQLRDYIAAFRKEREELDLVRQRLEARSEARAREAVGRSLGRFLEVVDNLERALSHASEQDPLREGIAHTLELLLSVLEAEGLERIDPLGEAFDPREAEAVLTREVGEEEHDRVVEVLRHGYRFEEKVLRAAQVAVGRFESPA